MSTASMFELDPRTAEQPCAGCGHGRRRHVKSSSGKRYCPAPGCRCGDYVETMVEVPESLTQPAVDFEATVRAHLGSGPAEWTGSICRDCGGAMQRTGACETCADCGSNTGCG